MKAPTALAAVAACILSANHASTAAQGWQKHCFDPVAPPVVIGANWQLTGPAIDVDVPRAARQLEVVRAEINNTCGLRVAPGATGVPIVVLVIDNQTSVPRGAPVTRELIAAGAVAIVGGGNSNIAPPAAQAAVEASIPFGANQAAADTLSGCTAAELADPAVTKSATPIYGPGQCWDNRDLVFRTTATGNQWGGVAARYARETHATLTTAAIVYRDDDFGRPNRDGFRDTFVELGGTVIGQAGFNSQTATKEDFKNLLRTVTAGDPSLVASNPNVARLKFLMQAYAELRDDPTWTAKPLNFDRITFVWTATVTGGSYSDLSPAALSALVNQASSIQPAWDSSSAAFQKWFALYRAFDPDAQPPASSFGMAAYDAMFIMALAITAAGSTDGAAVAAKIREVTNPPGKCIYPGDWEKAFRRLAKGKDINYEGALGSIDLDERGNPSGVAYGIFRFLPDGSTTLTGTFASAAQQSVCDDKDDEDEV